MGLVLLCVFVKGGEMAYVSLILCVIMWTWQATGATSSKASSKQQSDQQVPPVIKSQEMKPIAYSNKKFGFRFSLPRSWRGYSVTVTEWEGGVGRTYQPGEVIPPPEKGPLIVIGHPLSTKESPRQAITIMVFTKAQWHLIEGGKLIVSAAPVGPSELGRNSKYVFALPPRFNYALIEGWEEINEIIQNQPLRLLAPE